MREGDLSDCCKAIVRLILNEDNEWQNDEEPILICSECGADCEDYK